MASATLPRHQEKPDVPEAKLGKFATKKNLMCRKQSWGSSLHQDS
jgi:hypothetical protein